jgi:branched-chain amino acid transport system ATP-binding protein
VPDLDLTDPGAAGFASGGSASPGDPLLNVRALEVSYGPVVAVRNLSLKVGRGEIVALLGANGAGKTSTLRGITGLVRPTAGRIRFDGHRIEGHSPTAVVALGMAHVPEGRRVFPGLTVLDNLRLGGWGLSRRPRVLAARRDLVFGLFPRLAERRSQLAGSLSGGEQQMMAIGRALMSDPKLLLVDELSLGLSPIMVDELLAGLVALNRDGLSLLLIEQFVHRALSVATRVYLLSKGRVAFEGTSDEAVRSGAVESVYLMGAGT